MMAQGRHITSLNVLSQLDRYLSPQVSHIVKEAGRKAGLLGQRLYIVGGMVRDLLLGRPNLDLDLVVEGDAVKLARELAEDAGARLTVHTRFGTAKLTCTDFNLDLATARREAYSRPGALPSVQPGSLADDLSRRDFSINAMAICLTPDCLGEVIDPYNGKEDLQRRLIRILHPNSFIDDATRILRAIRYEQRLSFNLEPETGRLAQRDAGMLDAISSDRLRHELELILKEERPEHILGRAAGLGVLRKLHPPLRGDGWLEDKFERARLLHKRTPPATLYLCLLVYNLTGPETEQFISRLNFPARPSQAMRQTLDIKDHLHLFENAGLSPSGIYRLLQGYAAPAIEANALASKPAAAGRRLRSYLTRLRYIKLLLGGKDLMEMGIPPGQQMGDILDALRDARLNGEVRTREDEEKLVERLRHRPEG